MTAPAIVRRWAGPAPTAVLGTTGREQLARIRRLAPWGAALLTALFAHVAVLPHLAVRGIRPDGLLVAVLAVAAGGGARAGAAFGFAAGLGADLFLSTPLGTSTLAYTVVGHLTGRRATVLRRAGAAAALCTPGSACFACRTGRPHPADPAPTGGAGRPSRVRRRAATRRAALRRAVVVTVVGVGAGQLAVVAVATTLGGVPFPGPSGLLSRAGVAAASAPLGPPLFAAAARLLASLRRRP